MAQSVDRAARGLGLAALKHNAPEPRGGGASPSPGARAPTHLAKGAASGSPTNRLWRGQATLFQ